MAQVITEIPAPRTQADLGVSEQLVYEILCKMLYQFGEMRGYDLLNELKIEYEIIHPILMYMKREQLIESRGIDGVGDAAYRWTMTSKGREFGREFLEKSMYIGPVPVSLDDYSDIFSLQTISDVVIDKETLMSSISDLIFPEATYDQVGPAINSGRSMFLYGQPGNGKTALAESIAPLLGGEIFVPFGIEVDGHVIKVFDEISHVRVDTDETQTGDRRWVLTKRPVVSVGGELTLRMLDLIFDDVVKYYEAPLQMKANGGVLIIDDFGRQHVRPKDLLNRWIVPLEKRRDYLSMHTGKKIEVPFDQLVIFSTNIEPSELVDEAFLRRIRYKIEITSPDLELFTTIFRKECRKAGVGYTEEGFAYLVDKFYNQTGREFRGCQGRDLTSQITDYCGYHKLKPMLVPDIIDKAVGAYFVNVHGDDADRPARRRRSVV